MGSARRLSPSPSCTCPCESLVFLQFLLVRLSLVRSSAAEYPPPRFSLKPDCAHQAAGEALHLVKLSASPRAINAVGTPTPGCACVSRTRRTVSVGVFQVSHEPLPPCRPFPRRKGRKEGSPPPFAAHPAACPPARRACWRPAGASVGRQRGQHVACLGFCRAPPGKEGTTAPSDTCQSGGVSQGDEVPG